MACKQLERRRPKEFFLTDRGELPERCDRLNQEVKSYVDPYRLLPGACAAHEGGPLISDCPWLLVMGVLTDVLIKRAEL
jgi:hypothetical protein